jgi:hypothetical protein
MRTEVAASMLAVATVAGISGFNCALAQNAKTGNAKPKTMPYTTINHPEFVPASQATFLSATMWWSDCDLWRCQAVPGRGPDAARRRAR